MKFECKTEKLKNNVFLAQRATGKNLSLPVLGLVLINVSEKHVVIKATNLEIGIEFRVSAKIEKEGTVAVPGAVLSNVLGAFENDEVVRFELVGSNLSVKSKKHTTLIKTFPFDDFPTIPRVKDGSSLEIDAPVLTKGIQSVLFAVSTSDIKPEIASVYMAGKNKQIIFTGTDSFRLAEKKFHKKVSHIPPILLPHRNAAELVRFFDGRDGEVRIVFNKDQLALETEDVYFTSRLTDGVYPNYEQIMPTGHKTQAVVLKDELVRTLRAAQTFVDEFSKVNLRIYPADAVMEIEAKNTKVGENVSRIDAHLEGEDVEMSFNYRYFTEALPVIETDSVSLKLTEPNRPLVITPVGDDSFTYLIMPVNR